MNEHRPEVADVFRTYEKDFFARWGHVLSPEQRKAFAAIRDCRTAALGGHVEYVEKCDTCGHCVISCNSWPLPALSQVPGDGAFHVVFTLPQPIGGPALQNAPEIYNILSAPHRKRCSRLRPIPNVWAPPSAFIRTSTASCPAAASALTAHAGFAAGRPFFLPLPVLAAGSESCF